MILKAPRWPKKLEVAGWGRGRYLFILFYFICLFKRKKKLCKDLGRRLRLQSPCHAVQGPEFASPAHIKKAVVVVEHVMPAFVRKAERTFGVFWPSRQAKLVSSGFAEGHCLKKKKNRGRGWLRQVPDFNPRQSRIPLLNTDQGKYSLSANGQAKLGR